MVIINHLCGIVPLPINPERKYYFHQFCGFVFAIIYESFDPPINYFDLRIYLMKYSLSMPQQSSLPQETTLSSALAKSKDKEQIRFHERANPHLIDISLF